MSNEDDAVLRHEYHTSAHIRIIGAYLGWRDIRHAGRFAKGWDMPVYSAREWRAQYVHTGETCRGRRMGFVDHPEGFRVEPIGGAFTLKEIRQVRDELRTLISNECFIVIE